MLVEPPQGAPTPISGPGVRQLLDERSDELTIAQTNSFRHFGEIYGGFLVIELVDIKRFESGTKNEIWLVECLHCGQRFERGHWTVKKNTHGCNGCSKKSTRGSNSVHWSGGRYVPGYFVAKTKAACVRRLRTIEFNVSIEYLDELWERQGAKCYYSGEPICFGDNSTTQTASLDRIDSDGDYTEGNVVFVHKDVNLMKWKLPEARFIELCGKIIEKRGV